MSYRCPYCHSPYRPFKRRIVTTTDWVTFAALLLCCCWPLCWLPLVWGEMQLICPDCDMPITQT